jgi:hypothetical protein
LAIICFIVTAVQPLGFIGVSKVGSISLVDKQLTVLRLQEKTILYRRYVTLHGMAITAAFSLAGAWIIVSAARHSNAQAKCIQDFFNSKESEGTILCNIFSWVDVGIMGALWILLAILQGYLFLILSSYGRVQRGERGQYDRLYDPSQPLTENIPLGPTGHTDPWDSRRSIEAQEVSNRRYHDRTSSTLSGSEYLNNPNPEFPKYDPSYGYTSNAKRGPADSF